MNVNAHVELLGRSAKDRITGLKGTITSVSFDLYGCIQVVLQPGVDKDGKPRDGMWLDVNRLDLIGDKRSMPIPPFAPRPAEHAHGPAEKPAR